MKKLFLKGLFALATAFYEETKGFVDAERDRTLMSLVKNMHLENFQGCRHDILKLAECYADQIDVLECILNALFDVVELFGDHKGYRLMDEVSQRLANPDMKKIISDTLQRAPDSYYSEIAAQKEMVGLLQRVKQGPLSLEPGAIVRDVKYPYINVNSRYLSPGEFLRRIHVLAKKSAPETAPT